VRASTGHMTYSGFKTAGLQTCLFPECILLVLLNTIFSHNPSPFSWGCSKQNMYKKTHHRFMKCILVQVLRLCTGRTAHRGTRGIALPFHDHGTRRGEGLAPRPGRSLPRERPGTHCTGGWVGPRAGLDRCGKSRSPPGFDPRTVQPVGSRCTD
jgi:hypothetical protein